MMFEKTKVKKSKNSDVIEGATEFSLKDFETNRIITFLVKKHKFGLSVALNVVLAVYLVVPFLPGEVINYISRL